MAEIIAEPTNSFSPWDYVVFALVLCISAGIGIYYGWKSRRHATTEGFLMASRSMSVLPVALSLLASFMSAITLLGTPAEIYVFGTEYLMIIFGYCIMVPLAAHVFIPIFFKLKLTSVFEYLEMRFTPGVRLYAAILFIIQMTLYMAIVLYTPSLALNVVTGLNVWITVVTVGVVCTFYTTLGGMKAVMWTDVFQIVLMFAGLIAVLIQGSIDNGGFANIWNINADSGRVHFLTWDPHPLTRHSVWNLIFGGCFTWLAIYGVNQAQIQRALCVPRLKDAQIAMWINLPGLSALAVICGLCGMVVYAEYKDCDPIKAGRILAKDQLLPLYVMDRLAYPGLPGLFTACLFSGALSTISSGLNSLAAVTLQDIIRARITKNMTEARATNVSKILALVYGVVMIALSFVASQLGGVLQAALALFGMIGGPVLGVYILGVIYPFVNWKGAYAGLTAGLLAAVWVGIGANVYKPSVYKQPTSVANCTYANETDFTTYSYTDVTYGTTTPVPQPEDKPGYLKFYELSYMWYSAFAVLVCNIVGIFVSLITGPNKAEEMDGRLFCRIFDIFCCYLPWGCRHKLKCGVPDAEWDEDSEDLEKKQPSDWAEANGEKTNGVSTVHNNGFLNPAMEKSVESKLDTAGSNDHLQYETHL